MSERVDCAGCAVRRHRLAAVAHLLEQRRELGHVLAGDARVDGRIGELGRSARPGMVDREVPGHLDPRAEHLVLRPGVAFEPVGDLPGDGADGGGPRLGPRLGVALVLGGLLGFLVVAVRPDDEADDADDDRRHEQHEDDGGLGDDDARVLHDPERRVAAGTRRRGLRRDERDRVGDLGRLRAARQQHPDEEGGEPERDDGGGGGERVAPVRQHRPEEKCDTDGQHEELATEQERHAEAQAEHELTRLGEGFAVGVAAPTGAAVVPTLRVADGRPAATTIGGVDHARRDECERDHADEREDDREESLSVHVRHSVPGV